MRSFKAVVFPVLALIAVIFSVPANSAVVDAKLVGTVVYTFPAITPEMQSNPSAAFSPIFSDITYGFGGNALVLPNIDGGVVVIENGKGREIPPPAGTEQVGKAGTLLGDGKTLYCFKPKSTFSPASGGTLMALDLATGATKSIVNMDWEPRYAAISPDGTKLADDRSVSRPFKLDMLDLTTGKRITTQIADAPELVVRAYFEKANMWVLGWNRTSSSIYILRNEDGEQKETKTISSTADAQVVQAPKGAPSELGIWNVIKPGFSHRASFNGISGPNTTVISPTGEVVYLNDKAELYVASGDKSARRICKLDTTMLRPLISPTGKYLLFTATNAKARTGFTIIDLASGKSFSELRDPASFSVQPGTWHPTEDKFLAGISDDKGNVEVREYTAADLLK